MNWRITFYNKKIEKKTLLFPKGILANFLHIVEMMEEYGPALGKPYTAQWEMNFLKLEQKGRKASGAPYFVPSKAKRLSFCIHLLKKPRKHLRKK